MLTEKRRYVRLVMLHVHATDAWDFGVMHHIAERMPSILCMAGLILSHPIPLRCRSPLMSTEIKVYSTSQTNVIRAVNIFCLITYYCLFTEIQIKRNIEIFIQLQFIYNSYTDLTTVR